MANSARVATIVDPVGNKIVHYYSANITAFANPPYISAIVPTEVQKFINIGTPSSPAYASTPDDDALYCYNGNNTNCQTATVTYPITSKTAYRTLPGLSSSKAVYTYDSYGNITSKAEYNYGASSPAFTTTTTYGSWNGSTCTGIGGIYNRICHIVEVDNVSGNTIFEKKYTYDGSGNLLTAQDISGSSNHTSSYTYNANGTITTATDLKGTITSYFYNGTGGCSNLLETSERVSPVAGDTLTTTKTWDCNGAVVLTVRDTNGDGPTYAYNDPFFRVTSVTDADGQVTDYSYGANSKQSTMTVGTSLIESDTLFDSLGRSVDDQSPEASGSANYDTISERYQWNGVNRQKSVSAPCVITYQALCPGYYGNAVTDFVGRTLSATNPDGSYKSYSYSKNDVMATLGPQTSGENFKAIRTETDAFGRLLSHCNITSMPGSVSCGQAVAATGFPITYSYSYGIGSSTRVATNSSETKTVVQDLFDRTASTTTPESGTTNYYYDIATADCSVGSMGDLVELKFANGNFLCKQYDGVHRVTDIIPNSPSSLNTCRRFRYDNSTGVTGSIPTGIVLNNSLERMVEAETDNCTTPITPITDEWFSYDNDGRLTDVYELTPHSGGYYRSTVAYFGNGAVSTFAGIPGWVDAYVFALDGKGRWYSATQGNQHPVNAVYYNAADQPVEVDINNTSGDKDVYAYNPNSNGTGLMKQYQFTVNSISDTGVVTRNGNDTLASLSITDGFNAGGTQSCSFSYDDLTRLVTDSCGSIWSQTFSYDQYDNLSKSGSSTFLPGYNTKNQYTSIGATYDTAGKITYDSQNKYTWDSYGKMNTVRAGTSAAVCGTNGTCITYDATGRAVEKNVNGTYTAMLYGPTGQFATMNGSTPVNTYIPVPGGSTVLTIGSGEGARYFQHQNWLGNVRLETAISGRSVHFDRAFAPYGEMYDNFGDTGFLDFTGDRQILFSGLFDTPNREESQVASRWLSPDPAGDGWNAYAYPTNPNSEIDPSGLSLSYSLGDLHSCSNLGHGPTSCIIFSSDEIGACLTLDCILKKDNVAPSIIAQETKAEDDQTGALNNQRRSDAAQEHPWYWKVGHYLGWVRTEEDVAAERQWLQQNVALIDGIPNKDFAKLTPRQVDNVYIRAHAALEEGRYTVVGTPVGTPGTGFAGLKSAEPVGSALKDDLYHRSATWMRDAAAAKGTAFSITGASGSTSTLIQIQGDLNGVAGRYEYIVNSAGELSHQIFVPGGTINGVPIQP
jgi:RHS repeat-associated protein